MNLTILRLNILIVQKFINLFLLSKTALWVSPAHHNLFCPVTKIILLWPVTWTYLIVNNSTFSSNLETQINSIKHGTYHIHKGHHNHTHSWVHTIEHTCRELKSSNFLQVHVVISIFTGSVRRRIIKPSLCTKIFIFDVWFMLSFHCWEK